MYLPNYEKSEYSPVFENTELGLKIQFEKGGTRATFKKDQPWIVYGAFNVGQKVLTEFGKAIDSHIVLIVRHKETKAIYTGRVLKDELPGREEVQKEERGGRVISMGGYFTVDLKVQCKLKLLPGKYWVVALVEKLSSPVLEFEVND